ncbi:hypothetical protein Aduo_015228 [Ancylostoma duodenale]
MTPDTWRIYCEAKKAAKKAVAVAKAAYYDDVSRKLNSKDGERLIYRLAGFRERNAEDMEKFHGININDINDENGQLLMDRKKVMERWRDYFEMISTKEFAHPPIPNAHPTYAPIQPIIIEETAATVKRMKAGKAKDRMI